MHSLTAKLPQEHIVYLGDTARVPYGTKSPEVVTRYAIAVATELLKHDVKILVVACNTASSVALPALSARLPIPVIGVIEPGAAAAARSTKSGVVAVIGTEGTIRSGAYQRALAALAPNGSVRVQACPLFVPLVEGGMVPRRGADTRRPPLPHQGTPRAALRYTRARLHSHIHSCATSSPMSPEQTCASSTPASRPPTTSPHSLEAEGLSRHRAHARTASAPHHRCAHFASSRSALLSSGDHCRQCRSSI